MKMALIANYAMVSALMFAAVFGLYMAALVPMQHETGCLFASGETAVCAATLEHITHWQSAFTAVLAELLVLCAVVLIYFRRFDFFGPDGRRHARFRFQELPLRPTLFQELFSQGILHRKEP